MKHLVCVGSRAPNLALPALVETQDCPRVVAFLHRWYLDGERPEDVAAIRAELRGLGAELVVVSQTGVWSFGPDDHAERIAAYEPDELARERARFGVDAGSEAVFVADERGIVRIAHRSASSLGRGLAEAIAAAAQAIVPGPTIGLLTRREWNISALVTGFAFVFLTGCKPREKGRRDPPATVAAVPEDVAIELDVNGKVRALRVDARTSLLDALRERLGLTGTKKGCDMGQCGACTVLVAGERILSCLTLAVMVPGKKVTTIEGLANLAGSGRAEQLHPMQQAFVERDGLQCGYCTPGQIMSAIGMLAEVGDRTLSDDDVRHHMCGNLCRCGAYPNIVAAIQSAQKG